jgi:competence protein ComEA
MKKLLPAAIAVSFLFAPLAVSHASTNTTAATINQELVNINTASVKQLQKLPGIGKKKAQAIVEYRQLNGDFASLSDLQQVPGIGKKALVKLSDKVAIH